MENTEEKKCEEMNKTMDFSLKNELTSYKKHIAEVLQGGLPQPGLCHVNRFDVCDPSVFDNLGGQIGILTSSRVPQVRPFRLATKAGEVEMNKLSK